MPHDGELLTASEVATIFRVDPKTVTRWAREGKIEFLRTVGGRYRFPRPAVERLRRKSSN